MAKKILAIFFVSILLCSYIIPTTSAFADVVIGDNDSIVVTQQGLENGKKIATMEAMLQLLESGVSEINFNDVSDLDDYLEDFYDELTNVNYQDVSNEILAGAYNDVKQLKQWIDDRGEFIATYYKDMLNSADQGLTDIFNHFNLKLEKTSLSRTPLNGVRGMSRFSNDITPNPSPDYSFLSSINNIFIPYFSGGDTYNLFNALYLKENGGDNRTISFSPNYYTYIGNFVDGNKNYHLGQSLNGVDLKVSVSSPIITINVDTSNSNNVIVTYSSSSPLQLLSGYYVLSLFKFGGTYDVYTNRTSGYTSYLTYNQSSFAGLSSALNYIYQHYANINLFVDGVPWYVVDGGINMPTLDIDGFLKMYGNDNPVEYEFPQGTQIDYNALYTTIYNAIRDNLPLDMQTINNNQVYYDSHDTVYSPTIYNYYGKDGDDENDWIDSILDYATIPDFNSVLGTVAVLDAPFVNGITIVNAGVTDVIPTDILLIFGGFFVLVLFVCIINRMSE